MATPHVSGVVALLLSAKSSLKYDDIKNLLTGTVDTATLKSSGYNCGTTKDGVFPNNMYGYGRVNAFSAYKKATGGEPTPTAAPTSAPGPTPAPTTLAPTPARTRLYPVLLHRRVQVRL
jgi:subtilisin family serine protease